MSSTTLHEILKNYVIELGKNAKTRKGNKYTLVYSGDSQPIDIRAGKRHITYNPDVVFQKDGTLIIIEIAFTEDWRTVVGEITLAHLKEGCKAFVLITKDWDEDFLRSLTSILEDKMDFNIYWVLLEENELNNVELAKREIYDAFIEWGFI